MANRLTQENSLYLKQHANNPVDWWAWGEEAFTEARRQDKPLLISIGYSSCHWCHVMAHESFESEYIAGIMNEHFICIKVDREEHPEVDQYYMEAVQMITRHGGWPLNAFCLPDGRPFFGGTYFPPEDRGNGLIPWPQVLVRVSNYYREKQEELQENAEAIQKNMEHADQNIASEGEGGTWNPEFLLSAANAILRQHDDAHGGFGEAPKFPQTMTLDFLLQLLNTERAQRQDELRQRLESVLNRTLQAMAFGGIYDQIGGGFSRYSVDTYWLIPHFEKMLYDNGLLLDLYAKSFLQFKDPLYQEIAEEIIQWMDREMQEADSPLFSASIDADSEGEEGKFYVWSPEEIYQALPEEPEKAEAFCQAYGISNEGNFEHGKSQPALLSGERAARHTFREVQDKLYAVRAQRTWPQRDRKQLLSWNALAIRGRIEFFAAEQDLENLKQEGTRLEWILKTLVGKEGRLSSIYYPGVGPSGQATLIDYAFLLETLLSYTARADWVEPGSFGSWLERTESLLQDMERYFSDSELPGFFFASADNGLLNIRRKEWVDNAIPSGNSSLLHVYSTLHTLTGNSRYLETFQQLREVTRNVGSRIPTGVGHALSALTQDATGIALLKCSDPPALESLLPFLQERPWRRLFFQILPKETSEGRYQLCAGSSCLPPEEDPAVVADQIGAEVRPPFE